MKTVVCFAWVNLHGVVITNFDFEIDSYKNLKIDRRYQSLCICLYIGCRKIFKTPSLIYTISDNGTGQASRQLQSWARKYRVLDGEGERLTLLNNWEATYFNLMNKN
jgi:alpha-galactosidase